MTVYEGLKEEIIATALLYTGDAKALTTRLMTIINKRCVFLDPDQSLPPRTWETACCQQTIRKMLNANFKKVKEIKKEN